MTSAQASSLVVAKQIKLEIPEEVPSVIQNVFNKCMKYAKHERPDFVEVCAMLE